MAWHPNDLLTDQDLLAYESSILQQFAATDWQDKRSKALEDWLAPILKAQGYDIERLRTRHEPDAIFPFTGSAFTSETDDAKDTDADDLNFAAIFATPGSDALYIGSRTQFRGLSVRMHDSVSAVAAVLTVSYWNDAWTALTVTDGTQKTTGKAFSGGGAITWRVPKDWVVRAVNEERLYWVKLTISAVPTAATAGQIGVIKRSALCAPLTFRTLTLIMREAPTGGDGPWREKAEWYETEADAALQRALSQIGGEFESDDPPSDLISEEESEQTVEEVGGGFRWERA